MRICAYLRKSRADEVREKLESGYDALAHHRATLIELANRMNEKIAHWYCDGIKSGDALANRAEMMMLLDSVNKNQWDAVLCVEVERLTRGDMVDQGTVARAFLNSGTLIVTPNKIYDPASDADMEYLEFGLFMSRREFATIKKRLLAGRIAAVKDGQYIGQRPPYGYDKIVISGKHTLTPNENAQYILAIFDAFNRGESYRDIARMLDTIGAPTVSGVKWSANSVYNIVHNPVYIGKVRWNHCRQNIYRENGRVRSKSTIGHEEIITDGLHPPILSSVQWELAAKRVHAAPKRASYELRNYYGRLLVCAECGKALHYVDTGNATSPMLTHLRKGDGCKTKGCKLSVFDKSFTEALAQIANDIEISIKNDKPDTHRIDYEKSIEQAKKAIEANFDRMEREIISEADFIERRAILEKRINDATVALASLPDKAEKQAEKVINLKKCISMIADDGVDSETKRLIIWSLVEKIEYQNRAKPGENDIKLEIWLR